MSHRKWVKLFCDNWLRGSLAEDTLEVRALWAAVLALAGDGGYNTEGLIQVAPGIGYTDEQLARLFTAPLKTWMTAKNRLVETERISVIDNNVIHVTKWKHYQSEYDRQKRFRVRPKPEQ